MSESDTPPRRQCSEDANDFENVRIKQEPDDDIKDYAETTMNELLGWYGYGKVDSRDTQGLNLQHFATATSPGTSGSTPDGSGSDDTSRDTVQLNSEKSPGNGPADSPKSERSSLAADPVAVQHQKLVSALANLPKPPESPNLPPGCVVCAWCQKVGMKLFTLKTANGSKAFCSELCFTQCRRASFKKNKVCDWCKHVRHTVNYVDFQDGEQQLQFCSDKCLNQYKMNIFCKETQAHLHLHPHLRESIAKMTAGGGVNLITPDLWMRDCNNGQRMEDESEEVAKQDETDTVSTKPSVRKEKDKEKRPYRHPINRINKEPISDVRQNSTTASAPTTPPIRRQPRCPPPTDHLRSPFLPPHLSAIPQQQLDSFLRMQHSRLGAPPPIPLPHAPAPPFSHGTGLQGSPNSSQQAPSSSLLPPVTVVVPYPILIPLPVPIPIVIPLLLGLPDEKAKKNESQSKENDKISETKEDSNEASQCYTTENDVDNIRTSRGEKHSRQGGIHLKRKCAKRKLNSS